MTNAMSDPATPTDAKPTAPLPGSRAWLWVVVAHIVIITVLGTVLYIAKKYGPQEIPIPTVQPHTNER